MSTRPASPTLSVGSRRSVRSTGGGGMSESKFGHLCANSRLELVGRPGFPTDEIVELRWDEKIATGLFDKLCSVSVEIVGNYSVSEGMRRLRHAFKSLTRFPAALAGRIKRMEIGFQGSQIPAGTLGPKATG